MYRLVELIKVFSSILIMWFVSLPPLMLLIEEALFSESSFVTSVELKTQRRALMAHAYPRQGPRVPPLISIEQTPA